MNRTAAHHAAQSRTQRFGRARAQTSVARPSKVATSAPVKPINEIWWCGINPNGVPIWPTLDCSKANVRELLVTNHASNWEALGWRIARLQVTEIPHRKGVSDFTPEDLE